MGLGSHYSDVLCVSPPPLHFSNKSGLRGSKCSALLHLSTIELAYTLKRQSNEGKRSLPKTAEVSNAYTTCLYEIEVARDLNHVSDLASWQKREPPIQ